MARQTWGRCPDCGAAVLVTLTRGKPGEIASHACGARSCEYGRCRVKALMDDMVQFPTGEWYCPRHGLLLAARDLVALYRVEGDADWTAICEIIDELLPELLAKAEAWASGKTSLDRGSALPHENQTNVYRVVEPSVLAKGGSGSRRSFPLY